MKPHTVTLTITGIEPGSRYAIIDPVTNEVFANELVEDTSVSTKIPTGTYITRVRKAGFKSFEIDETIVAQPMTVEAIQIRDYYPEDERKPSRLHELFDRAMDKLFDPELDLTGIDIEEDK